jgi:phage tail sheath protein FI
MQVSYPGVYVEELSSGVHTITGVATSIAAFVDVFASGPMDTAVQIFSFADFERQFGGLNATSEASYAIQQFFLNGGSQAYVVRVTSTTAAKAATAAAIGLADTTGNGAATVLAATAKNKGAAGNLIRIEVDYGTAKPDKTFNLTVTQLATAPDGSTRTVATEVFRNLLIDPAQQNDATATVNAASQLITLTSVQNSAGKRPAASASVSDPQASASAAGIVAADVLSFQLNGGDTLTTAAIGNPPATLTDLAAALQKLIRAATKDNKTPPALPSATVAVAGSSAGPATLVVKSGTGAPGDVLALTGAIATKLNFTANVAQYALGADTGAAGQILPAPGGKQLMGSDGQIDIANDADGITGGLIGDPVAKTGMYALLNVDIFNILCIPATMNLPDPQAALVVTDAEKLCSDRRAMYILDVPQGAGGRDTVPAISQWLDANAGLRSANAALYFPRTQVVDPLAGYRERSIAPSGTAAGVWARTDANRGVWKAPAGTEATLSGVQQLGYKLTDPENGVLNPMAINCLRVFPIYGPVMWGARTLFGADQMANEWKYLPIRRLALFIEESLFRGTQWVVFEPNDEPLWSQIRLNVGAFMQTLFLQGAFQGKSPQDAYFVRCDATTNPQILVNQGIVTISVGFAPLKPAEFVVLQIQQISSLAAA